MQSLLIFLPYSPIKQTKSIDRGKRAYHHIHSTQTTLMRTKIQYLQHNKYLACFSNNTLYSHFEHQKQGMNYALILCLFDQNQFSRNSNSANMLNTDTTL